MSEQQPTGATGDGETNRPQDGPPVDDALPPIVPPHPAPSPAPAPSPLPEADSAPTALQPAVTELTRAQAPIAAAAEPASTPISEENPVSAPRKRRGGKIAAWSITGVVLLAGAVYAGAAYLTQDRMPAHLSVDGIDLSGLSASAASTKLQDELGSKADKAIQLTAGDQTLSVKPSDAGLGIDVPATLDHLTGLSWDPQVIASRIFGTLDTSAVQTSDPAKLTASVEAAAKDLDSKAVEGNVAFAQGEASLTEPKSGLTVDVAKTADSLKTQWLHSDGTIAATANPAEPAISVADWKSFLKDKAAPLVNGAMTVSDGNQRATLSAAQLGSAAKVGTDGGTPTLGLNGDQLLADVIKANPKMKTTGKDATLKLEGSGADAKPVVVAAKQGKGIDSKDLIAAIEKASTSTDRTATVTPTTVEPTVTTAQVEKYGVDQVVAKLDTPYPTYDTVRTKNLRNGAAKVNGTVVMPGEEFNLGDRFGPITLANGYVVSGVVSDGKSSNAMGGGISQIATMSYNAGYLSGAEMLQYKAHSRWFDRYPAGQESTFWTNNGVPEVNVRWKNTTDAPLVVQMWVTSDKVHMQVWGKKYWDVKVSKSEKYNLTYASGVITGTGAGCVPENTRRPGFTIKVTRTLTHNGTAEPAETRTTTYSPWPHVVCK